MASELKVDKITGVTTAGSIDVTGEGGSTTTNLQQGLCKSWVHFDGSDATTVVDDLNVDTIADNGTGNFTINFTNNFANVNYAGAGQAGFNDSNLTNSRIVFQTHDAPTTSAFRIGVTIDTGTEEDSTHITQLFMGDLA
mgnify:CR=1 FL=1|tara:strand:+ start:109 stop:525 length:417 start_codon:yes stop_codon:yes gene_type:complete